MKDDTILNEIYESDFFELLQMEIVFLGQYLNII